MLMITLLWLQSTALRALWTKVKERMERQLVKEGRDSESELLKRLKNSFIKERHLAFTYSLNKHGTLGLE